MQDKNIIMAKKIAELVSEKGGSVYYVGGFVRDGILGIESKDVDIEVHGITPDELYAILQSVGTPTIMGASFGIYGLAHYDLDISMPKKEGMLRGGKNDLAAVSDPFIGTEKSAARRDLTINALMRDVLTGEIKDHFNGIEDMKNGVIRHVRDDTFVQDPLRVLRAAQFAARFGFEVASETVELCKKQDLTQLPFERVFEETKKALMRSQTPSVFFEMLRKMDALDIWFPEVKALIGVEQPAQHHAEGDVWTHTMMVIDLAAKLRADSEYPEGFMLSALCHDFGKVTTTRVIDGRIRSFGHETEGIPAVQRFIKRLTADKRLLKYVSNMTELHMRPNIMASQHSSSKAFCKLFDSSVCPRDLLLLSESDFCGRITPETYEERKQYLAEMIKMFDQRMALPYVTGDDLIKAGCKPGKELGKALEYAHKLRLAGVDKENALRQTLAFLR